MRLLSTFLVGLASVIGVWSSPAKAIVIDYTSFGTFSTPSFTNSGVTVTAGLTGNAAAAVDVTVNSTVDGTSDGLGADEILNLADIEVSVDNTEFLDFSFAIAATNVSYEAGDIGNGDLDALFGERQLDIFAPGGALLGIFLQDGNVGSFDISSLVGGALIGGFQLSALGNGDDFTVTSLSLAPVPLPAAAWLLLTALGGMGLLGWRRKRTAEASA